MSKYTLFRGDKDKKHTRLESNFFQKHYLVVVFSLPSGGVMICSFSGH